MLDRNPPAASRSVPSIGLSVAVHGALVVALFAVRFTVESPQLRSHTRVSLVAPVAVRQAPQVSLRRRLRAAEIHVTAKVAAPSLPSLLLPIDPPVLGAAPLSPMVVEVPPATKPISPKEIFPAPPQVRIGEFASVSSASTQSGPAAQIATAGFGDAGIASSARTGRMISSSVEFGDSGVSGAAAMSRHTIAASGFGDAESAAPKSAGARPLAPGAVSAAQIIEKPRPAYTEEARRLRIEGEVQLEVLFRASGQIDILRVVRGLGHGLDENAARAAQTIRFLPAKKEGRPVDSTATVHIIFQLAS